MRCECGQGLLILPYRRNLPRRFNTRKMCQYYIPKINFLIFSKAETHQCVFFQQCLLDDYRASIDWRGQEKNGGMQASWWDDGYLRTTFTLNDISQQTKGKTHTWWDCTSSWSDCIMPVELGGRFWSSVEILGGQFGSLELRVVTVLNARLSKIDDFSMEM